jgi:hypothetical protein
LKFSCQAFKKEHQGIHEKVSLDDRNFLYFDGGGLIDIGNKNTNDTK